MRQRVALVGGGCVGLLVIALVLLLRARSVTRAQCTEMLDHYIDMSIDADPELAHLSPAQRDAAREMKRAIRKTEKTFVRVQRQCETEIRHREYDCAMHAPTPNDWEACLD